MVSEETARRISGWQSIEAAPKGNEPVLVFMPEAAQGLQFCVCHQDDDGDWYDTARLGHPIDVPITHWMLLERPEGAFLPDPPQGAA